jgi:translation elongation factor EF-Ts
MNKIEIIKQFNQETGVGLHNSKQFLEYADYDFALARKIAEYHCLAVKKGYAVGKIIREYWLDKEKNKYRNN